MEEVSIGEFARRSRLSIKAPCPRLRRGMPHSAMIEAHNLVKRYGSTMAVNDLSFSIRPGMVTGFLGPNGAGKTTTMRMILGLEHADGGLGNRRRP